MRIVEKSRVLASGNVADKFRVSHRELELAASIRDGLPEPFENLYPLLRLFFQQDALGPNPVIELSSGSGRARYLLRCLALTEGDLAVQNIDSHTLSAPRQ